MAQESDERWYNLHGQDLLIIAGTALVVRLLYLVLAISNMGLDAFASFAPDTSFYNYVAEHLIRGHGRGPSIILMIGPGYGGLIAITETVFGSSPLAAILLNVALGTLSPLLVYGLAQRLIRIRKVSMAAGLINALSLTAIVCSTHILSDQPLFTFYAAALYCFVVGYQQNSIRWYIAAGLLAGMSAYIRGSGQIALILFLLLPFVLPVSAHLRGRRQFLIRSIASFAVAAMLVYGWAFRNYVQEDQFVFSTIGMLTMRHCLVAQCMAENDEDQMQVYRAQWGIEDGESDLERYREAYPKAKERVMKAWQEMPGKMLYYFLYNVRRNIAAPNSFVGLEIPSLDSPVKRLNTAVRNYLGYGLALISMSAVIILIRRRNGLAAWILGFHFVVFTLFCGSSFWQGSRLHYTAEMAWAILVPYMFYSLYVTGKDNMWPYVKHRFSESRA
jgi:4-amino-4-deoxy-L-arabinose transferase-like glycosyltransferase